MTVKTNTDEDLTLPQTVNKPGQKEGSNLQQMVDNARAKKQTGKRDKASAMQVRDSAGSAAGKPPSQGNINLANMKPQTIEKKYEAYLEKPA